MSGLRRQAIATPCIGVCKLDGNGQMCLGCGRTLGEIGRWGAMSDAERLAVMARLKGRAAGAERSER